MNNKQLYLIDGHALIYRAYFALIRTPLTNAQGLPTSAVMGFANYLIKLLADYSCPYIAVVMDSPSPTFRHKMFDQYKANREAMPDDMRVQMPYIDRLIEAMNMVKLQRDGLEADDIIAWCTQQAVAQGFDVSLVTRDKDLMQLIGPHVRMLAPETGGKMEVFGSKDVQLKMGVLPEQIRDMLALTGDASDNIPGVPGVGPKTAQKILEKAGSLENLLANPACVDNPKLQAKIETNRDVLILSRELATLHADIDDMGITVESLASKPVHAEACIELFKELDFHALLKHPLFDTAKNIDYTTHIPVSLDDVRELTEKIHRAGSVSIDTETTSLVPHQADLVGISMSIDGNDAWYIPVGHTTESFGSGYANLSLHNVLDILRPILESPDIAKSGQNLKYDYQIFKRYNIKLAGIAFDAMIAAYLVDPGTRRYGLEALAHQWLGASTIPIEQLIGKGKGQINFADVSITDAARYSCEDAILPLRLKHLLESVLTERSQMNLFKDIEIPLVTVLAELEWQGVCIDTGLLQQLSADYTARLAAISADIFKLAGTEFNINSPKQVSEILFTRLGLPHSKKRKTGMSTDVDALEKLANKHPIVPKLLEYRELQKLLSTYIDAFSGQMLPETGRLHTSFNQTVTATGRLSSTNPNLQNIPVRTEAGKKIREAFIAPPGYVIVSADYSQIELRLLAHVSKDSLLVQAFLDDRDIHTQTASALYGIFPEMVTTEMRRNAKAINFGLIYGMGPINLSRQIGVSFAEAQEFIDTYFRQFPSIEAFMAGNIEMARQKGYAETLLGRRRYLPEINADNRQIRESAERIALNTPLQGSAADIIKIAMVTIHRDLPKFYPDVAMLLQVHDELVFQVPERMAGDFKLWVADRMSTAYILDVPLKVDAGIGKNWSDAH